MLSLKLILNNWSLQQNLETVEQLKAIVESLHVIEALRDHTGESPLQLFHFVPELEEILFKFLLLNIHDVVLQILEYFSGDHELVENSLHTLSEVFSFSSSNPAILQFVELLDGASDV